jgi:hypothetical protein
MAAERRALSEELIRLLHAQLRGHLARTKPTPTGRPELSEIIRDRAIVYLPPSKRLPGPPCGDGRVGPRSEREGLPVPIIAVRSTNSSFTIHPY